MDDFNTGNVLTRFRSSGGIMKMDSGSSEATKSSNSTLARTVALPGILERKCGEKSWSM